VIDLDDISLDEIPPWAVAAAHVVTALFALSAALVLTTGWASFQVVRRWTR
jgi:Tfp pilus assembly protein PilO